MATKTTRVFLDRIEGDVAVLLESDAENASFDLPRRLLPDGVREGTALTLTLTVDEEATTAGKKEVADLMADLLNPNRPKSA